MIEQLCLLKCLVLGQFDFLGTNATSSGWRRYAIKQYLVPGLQPLRSSPTLIPLWNLRFASDFKVTFRYGFRLFVFVYALHSVVKPTHAPVFITTLRFIQTIASLKGFDRTIRSITLLVSTPRVLHARRAITPCPYFNHAKIILPNIWYCIGRLTEHRFTYWLRPNVLRST